MLIGIHSCYKMLKLWVGEGSMIPNVQGLRKDIVEALKAMDSLWLGGLEAALLMLITGKTGLKQ